MILRNFKADVFEYNTFETLLFDVRFELTKNRLMDTNYDKMVDHLMEIF